MNLELRRTDIGAEGCFGALFDANGYAIAVTLEHAYPVDGGYAPKIPAGTYTCVRGTHQLEHGGPFETFEITGVPGHIGVLLHCGNLESDSEGCVLLGTTRDGAEVLASRTAFNGFMAIQQGCDAFQLTVLDPEAG